jgi:hypothetical protein
MTFTVVITVFERTELLANALFSVYRQDWPDWNAIIIADGPHLTAGSMVDQFRLKVPEIADRIKYLTLPQALGAWGNVSRYRGLELATGDYTVFIGHDCIMFPGYLAAHAENVAKSPGCLSLVDIDMWTARSFKPGITLPHPEYLGIRPKRKYPFDAMKLGDVDLTCMAFPTERARQIGVFARKMKDYCADHNDAYLLCIKAMPVVHRPGVVAGHF